MIRINLLPPEQRPSSGPSTRRLLLILAEFIVLGAALSVFLVLVLVTVPSARDHANHLRTQCASRAALSHQLNELIARRDGLRAQQATFDEAIGLRKHSMAQQLLALGVEIGSRQAWLDYCWLSARGERRLLLLSAGADVKRLSTLLADMREQHGHARVVLGSMRYLTRELASDHPHGPVHFEESAHFLLDATLLPEGGR